MVCVFSSWCIKLVCVLCLFLMVPGVGLCSVSGVSLCSVSFPHVAWGWSVIVALCFPGF